MGQQHHRSRHQQASQRPAVQQTSTRPEVGGEPAHDNVRVPSPATVEQSQHDAQIADPDRYEPKAEDDMKEILEEGVVVTEQGTSPISLASSDPTDADIEELKPDAPDDGVAFTGFAPGPEAMAVEARAHRTPQEIDAEDQRRREADMELVPVIPRRTVMRTSIGGKWWNFVKGQEQFVPQFVREHLMEKGVL